MGQARTARARFELTDQLPDDLLVVPLEREGEIVWAVRRGEMTPELVEQVNRLLEHITRDGLWLQQWDDRQPPHLYRAAS